MTFFLNIALDLHTFDFVAFRAAGRGLFQQLALPTAEQGRRNALGMGHVGVPDAGGHSTWRTHSALKVGVYFFWVMDSGN